MRHLPVYGLDIETAFPSGPDRSQRPEPITGEHPAVDPRHTIVVRAVVSTAAIDHVFEGDEVDLLGALDATLADLEPGVVATWNGSGFDLPYLADRAGACGVQLGLRLAADPRRRPRGGTLPGHRHVYRAAWYDHRHLDATRLFRSARERPGADRFDVIVWRPRRAETFGPADVPGAEITHDAVHAFASNDARLVRSLVESRMGRISRHVDRIQSPAPSRRTEPQVVSTGLRPLLGRVPWSPAHPAVRAAMSAEIS